LFPAYTSSEETNYYFDVQHQYLAEALDRFSQFFIAPLFTESATSRELLAVHAEHSKNLQNDSWRQYQLEKSMANAAHPLSRFGTGCAETLRDEPARLGIDVRAALLEFHDRFYSSNLMTLAVVGRESLDELQRLVEELFGNVKNKQRVVEIEQVEPFSADSFQRLDYVVPVKDLRTLSLTWLCPSVKPFYHSKPSSILSNLIGHEASGSILSTLKEKGWATSMSAGTEHSFAQFSIFGVSVDLTEQGLMHCDEIAHIVYAYIALLRSPTATDSEFQRIFTEISDVARMNFEFKSKEKPMNYVSQLSNYLKLYAPTDVLTGSRLYPNFDLPLIRKFLDCLRPERCRMSVVAHAVADKCNLTERWYGVQYGVSKWTADQLALFSGAAPEHVPDLHIPHPNEFISTDFTIYAQPKSKSATCCSMDDSSAVPIHSFPSPPSLLSHDDRHRLWFKLDDVFCKPKLNVIIEIFSAHASSTPKSEVLTKLFSELLQVILDFFFVCWCFDLA
jgi:insulysin